ncbi:UNVERIFIED_CONTAM: hypothetical protein K2H54_041715 [Gekko kuhli]
MLKHITYYSVAKVDHLRHPCKLCVLVIVNTGKKAYSSLLVPQAQKCAMTYSDYSQVSIVELVHICYNDDK